MAKFLMLFSFMVIFFGCGKNKDTTVSNLGKNPTKPLKTENNSPIEDSRITSDTIYSYWAPILDTISDSKKRIVNDRLFSLSVSTYSLNDSLFVRRLGRDSNPIYLDHSHSMVTDVNLSVDAISSHARITRSDFREALDEKDYTESNLMYTHIDSISLKAVYLSSDMAIPDTDIQWEIRYFIAIRNHQLKEIKLLDTEYVGL